MLTKKPASKTPKVKIFKEIPPVDPKIAALVQEIIARVADKWTMLILETLEEDEALRFTQVGKRVGAISQKMLTQTLRQMESDGLVIRTIHPVIPPHVDYRLTKLGISLSYAFCGVWQWAEKNYAEIEKSRDKFRQQTNIVRPSTR